MLSQCGQTLSGLWVPELDGLLAVFAARHHQAFSGMPVDTLHISTVTCAHTQMSGLYWPWAPGPPAITMTPKPEPNLEDIHPTTSPHGNLSQFNMHNKYLASSSLSSVYLLCLSALFIPVYYCFSALFCWWFT